MSLLAMVAVSHMLRLAVAHQGIGIFEGSGDIGTVKAAGSSAYDDAAKKYAISGSGENIWFEKDAFHFAWKKVSGDISISADVDFAGKVSDPLRKVCLMVRQSLEPNSPYVDIARHGNGSSCLQYRDGIGEATHEIQSIIGNPKKLVLEKRGDYVTASLSDEDGNIRSSGGSVRFKVSGEFYIGVGVCSHQPDAVETVTLSNLEIKRPTLVDLKLQSTLETIDIDSANRRVVKVFGNHIEAPNWTPDGKTLIYNSDGYLFSIPAYGGVSEQIETGFANKCNNDHGVSPDGRSIVISDQSQEGNLSCIYVLPIEGGTPRKVTDGVPSYWHGWSPDGKTLAICGLRDGKFGIFTVPIEGGAERRLTTAVNLDDGPDYSPDGKFIYFNSDRSGKMQIYRMSPLGENIEAMTSDESNNWFPHVSPDGKWIVFLTYEPDVQGHPPNKDVMLRLMNLQDRKVTILAKFFGGQGTINVPSWSPDSKRIAFVSYQMVP